MAQTVGDHVLARLRDWQVEQGHYEVSVAVAEQHLLPAVRRSPEAVVLADGFSCRTQLADLADLADRPARHLAELLASALDGPGRDAGSPR